MSLQESQHQKPEESKLQETELQRAKRYIDFTGNYMLKFSSFEASCKKTPFAIIQEHDKLSISLMHDDKVPPRAEISNDLILTIRVSQIQELKELELNFSLSSAQDLDLRKRELIYVITNLTKKLRRFTLNFSQSAISDNYLEDLFSGILKQQQDSLQPEIFELNLQK